MAILALAAAVAITVALVAFMRWNDLSPLFIGTLALIVLSQIMVVVLMTLTVRNINAQLRKDREAGKNAGRKKRR